MAQQIVLQFSLKTIFSGAEIPVIKQNKTVVTPCYIHTGNSYASKMVLHDGTVSNTVAGSDKTSSDKISQKFKTRDIGEEMQILLRQLEAGWAAVLPRFIPSH